MFGCAYRFGYGLDPCWQAGVLLMDLNTLRRLETVPPAKQMGMLQKDEVG